MLALAFSLLSAAQSLTIPVPVIACTSDGQLGPQPAPEKPDRPILVATDIAPGLAYYVSTDGPDVLAPRGWYCRGLSGSDGSLLFVTPDEANIEAIVTKPGTYDGPAVVGSLTIGATSGRYAVWEAIARYFPKFLHTIDQALWSETMEDPLPQGPFPADIVEARTDRTIRLTTPANEEGQGTTGYLGRADRPLESFRHLLGSGDESALLGIDVRLPPEKMGMAQAILDSERYAR